MTWPTTGHGPFPAGESGFNTIGLKGNIAMKQRFRLAIDRDEVIADAFTAQWEWYRRPHHYDWPVESLGGKHFSDLAHPDHVAMMEELLHQGDFFGAFGVMPGSQKALEQLSSRFEIFITTAAMESRLLCL